MTPEAPPRPRAEDRGAQAAVLAQWTLACCAVWALLTVLPLHLTQTRRLGAGTVAVLVTEGVVCLRLMRVLAGQALGRLRPGTAIRIALALGAAAFGVLAVADGHPVALAAVLPVIGLAFGMNAMALKLIAAAAPASGRTKGFAAQAVAVNIGMALGPLAGVAVQQRFGMAAFCLAAAGANLVALGPVLAVRPPGGADRAPVGVPLRAQLKLLVRDPGPRLPLALTALGFVLYTQLFATLPLYAHGVLGGDGSLGTVFLVNGLLIIVLQMPLVLVTGRLGLSPITLCVLGFACFAAAFACLGAGHGTVGLFAGVVLVTFGEMLLMPSLDVLVGGAGPSERHAVYFSLAALATGLGEAFGSFAGVRIANAPGLGPASLYVGLAALTAVGVAAAVALRIVRPARS
ncbi:MFS transporter [Streptomyces sp. NBC_00250]|uniref:MFS transporter n=1 Tax=Streptomyces sp. NBC_00250 TaxID=2903641 RepID=UPI002E2BDBC0|nr:MFS transporter [Streptomyces sp. NBC_00250]